MVNMHADTYISITFCDFFALKEKKWLWNINIFTIPNIVFGQALVFVISYMFLFTKDLHYTSIIQSKKYMSNLSNF